MKVAIFGSVAKNGFIPTAERLLRCIGEYGCGILLYHEVRDTLEARDADMPADYAVIGENDDFSADLVFSIGGDGTFLKTAMRIKDKGIPIMGIKLGNLGFLVDMQTSDIENAVQDIMRNGFSVEKRSLLQLKTDGLEYSAGEPYALNEVAVLKRDSSSMLKIDATLNGEFFCCYRADGLLVSTPTGSTAYALSVGGPILMPQNHSLVISPVASHSLNLRPVVIPDNWCVDLKVSSRSGNFMVSLDGRSQVLDNKTGLHIQKAPFCTYIAKRRGHTYFQTLREKFLWGADVRL